MSFLITRTGQIGYPEDSLQKDEFNQRYQSQKDC